jgi:peptide/nickel transport system permease protein
VSTRSDDTSIFHDVDHIPETPVISGDEFLPDGELELVEGAEEKPRTQWQLFRRRFFRHKMAVVGLAVLTILVIACFGADWIAPYARNQQNLADATQSPSLDHLMGTDRLGRDLLTEILYAGQVSLTIGFAVALISTAVGTTIGACAAYFGRATDQVLSRITDLFLVVPALLVAATALSYVRRNAQFLWWDVGDSFLGVTIDVRVAMILVLAFLSWTYIARIVRGQVLSLKEKEFVEAARASGASSRRIITRHILPNSIGVITVNATLAIAVAIVTEATLSFLGFGLTPPNFSWGYLIYDARGTVGTANAYLLYFPGLMLLITVLCVNFLGDGLRDAFDPHGGHEL